MVLRHLSYTQSTLFLSPTLHIGCRTGSSTESAVSFDHQDGWSSPNPHVPSPAPIPASTKKKTMWNFRIAPFVIEQPNKKLQFSQGDFIIIDCKQVIAARNKGACSLWWFLQCYYMFLTCFSFVLHNT